MNWKALSFFVTIIVLNVTASCIAQQRSADAQAIPTVTPLPGPVATQQAAQEKINQAQADKARADELTRAAADQSRRASDDLNAAQASYNAAAAAITAQQIAVANGLIGEGNAKVQSALSQIDQLARTVNEHQRLFDAQSAERISDTITIRDLTRDKAQILAAYNASAAQLQAIQSEPKSQPASLDAAWLLAGFGLLAILLIVVVFVISRRGAQPVPAPPRSAFYDAEVIDNETQP